MWLNSQFPADLGTFNKETLMENFIFFPVCADLKQKCHFIIPKPICNNEGLPINWKNMPLSTKHAFLPKNNLWIWIFFQIFWKFLRKWMNKLYNINGFKKLKITVISAFP